MFSVRNKKFEDEKKQTNCICCGLISLIIMLGAMLGIGILIRKERKSQG